MPRFRVTRHWTETDIVEVDAIDKYEAKELAEDDDVCDVVEQSSGDIEVHFIDIEEMIEP